MPSCRGGRSLGTRVARRSQTMSSNLLPELATVCPTSSEDLEGPGTRATIVGVRLPKLQGSFDLGAPEATCDVPSPPSGFGMALCGFGCFSVVSQGQMLLGSGEELPDGDRTPSVADAGACRRVVAARPALAASDVDRPLRCTGRSYVDHQAPATTDDAAVQTPPASST